MHFDFKKGKVRLEGSKPMEVLELADDLETEPLNPNQEAVAGAVLEAIKQYLETTESLSNEKYLHLRDKIPGYLSSPGNLLIAVCIDGVVVRYEKKGSEESKMVLSIMPRSIAKVAALLSQNLVHIETADAPVPTNKNFGVKMSLFAYDSSGRKSQEIAAIRIWFQAREKLPKADKHPGAKPYCLLSVRNQLEFEIHGVHKPEDSRSLRQQPFILRSSLRLIAGWDCIEVFPGLDPGSWNSGFAPLWAEQDVLGAMLISQTKDAQLRNLDPRASTRRQYASLLSKFKSLLDSNPEREQLLQSFLQENPVVLCPTHVHMWPKLPLGSMVTDFVFRDANQEYLLVELERSTLQLFRQNGHPTADLTHAHGQILDWKRYLEDNLATVQRELGLTGITPNPNALLVIGRSQSLQPRDRRKLQTMASESPKLRIMTYDDVYANARAVFENLLGPIWDPGGSTEIYYPIQAGRD